MKPILKTKASKRVIRTGAAPDVPAGPAANATFDKPVFSVSSLKITKPRTAKDIERAIAQGRVAEIKLD
ncbi:hypothetical protein [Massilia aquatica]|uniref:Uncharacterized protein n=1 Tax=Massilia aquatica TaxID=2609000 RepID=A0ABX0M6F8_9BURK|nr:hypothetical protein [Massilia aquatica]NHZ39154.1 hypothetical protein [Massilia aquatica]